MHKLSLGLICLLMVLPSVIKADLPVHCLKHHAVGTWTFMIEEPKTISDPFQNSCGHEWPDNPAKSYLAKADEFSAAQTFQYELSHENSAKSVDGNYGKWTMIYDEGMDVHVDEHRFTAYFRYFPNENGRVLSNCGKTLVGWYENTSNGKKACFKADKIVSSDNEAQSLLVEPLEQMNVVQPKETLTMLQRPKNKFLGEQAHEGPVLHKDFNEHHKVVEHLDKFEKSWSAGVHGKFEGKSFAELNKMAGRKKAFGVEFEGQQRKTLKTSLIQTADVSDLPKEFNWASKIKEPREQKDCGSCYVFATMKMMEARIDIQYGDDVRLSPQHVLDCSYHNQGCDGGYPFLVNKFSSQFDLVPEHCSPYKGVKGSCGQCDTNLLQTTYKASNYGFVGGAYGSSNERNIMTEIMNNGPVVMSFEPRYDFMYYQSGVYHSVVPDYVQNHSSRPEWERVDHSVLCYGWGETEAGEKYWLLQNSWGNDWGENGSFRMRRGVDESAIESLVEFATPVKNSKY